MAVKHHEQPAQPVVIKTDMANGAAMPPEAALPQLKHEHAAESTRGRDEAYLDRIAKPAVPSTHSNIAPPPETAPAGPAAGIASQDPRCDTLNMPLLCSLGHSNAPLISY